MPRPLSQVVAIEGAEELEPSSFGDWLLLESLRALPRPGGL